MNWFYIETTHNIINVYNQLKIDLHMAASPYKVDYILNGEENEKWRKVVEAKIALDDYEEKYPELSI